MNGKVNAIQSFATLDGPGVRYAVFLQGCPLRCACCHNPETWELNGGTEYTAVQLVEKVKRYKEYFGTTGGITVSGGEPLLQTEFVTEVFTLCKQEGINTCLDTSGSVIGNNTENLLKVTDHCLLDIKYTTDEMYKKYVGCGMEKPLEFLRLLQKMQVNTVVRQVTIGGLNDTKADIEALKAITENYNCVIKTELLPFRKLCIEKYRTCGIDFPLESVPETTSQKIEELTTYL